MGSAKKKIPRGFWIWLAAALTVALYVISQSYRDDLRDFLVDDTRFASEIETAAERHGLPPQLVRAVVRQESKFDPDAEGKAGEIGLMQVWGKGAAADWARVNQRPVPAQMELYNVELNLEIGCWYLGKAVKKWKNYRCGIELALAEYNAGAKNSARWKPANPNAPVVERIDFPVTRNYVQQIMKYYRKYSSEAGGGFKNP
ncbi:MAG: transglycosylase SLT domain-containing protein [Lentisphaeria bacterium]|nr:transglycosylase SLT domain-containing protein [Lentisphaeria bacterium]